MKDNNQTWYQWFIDQSLVTFLKMMIGIFIVGILVATIIYYWNHPLQ